MREWFVQYGSIKSYAGNSVDVYVPSRLYDKDVDCIDGMAFSPYSEGIKEEKRTIRENIQSVTIEPGIKIIGGGVFEGCRSLVKVSLPDTIERIYAKAFSDCTALVDCCVPERASIDKEVFTGCTSLKRFVFPRKMEVTPMRLFQRCTNLIEVILPQNLRVLSCGTFDKCEKLKSICIPLGVEEIGDYAFGECRSLEAIELPDGIEVLEAHTFNGCTSLKHVRLPAHLKEIHQWAFRSCTSLENIDLPDGLSTIQLEAFQECLSLKEIVIPEAVQELPSAAFKECPNLNRIVISGKETRIVDENRWERRGMGWNAEMIHLPFETGFNANPQMKIVGYRNSPAEQYAHKYNFEFIDI